MKTQQCEYNFGCEDYAEDGTWKRWGEWVDNNAPAKHYIQFHDKEQNCEFEYNVCDGCLATLENTCDDDENYELLEERRIAPETKSYDGKRGKKYESRVFRAWTQEDLDSFLKTLHKVVEEQKANKEVSN